MAARSVFRGGVPVRREQLDGGLVLYTEAGWADLTTDTLTLAAFCQADGCPSVCDLGCGGGALLLLLASVTTGILHGVESLPEAAALCRYNLHENRLQNRATVFEMDIREFTDSGYDLVVSNPPYFPLGCGKESRDPRRRVARFETQGTIVDFCATAARIMTEGGRFCCVFPCGRQADLDYALEACGLYVSRRRQNGTLLLTESRKKSPLS